LPRFLVIVNNFACSGHATSSFQHLYLC
jgi:hypothetical protein